MATKIFIITNTEGTQRLVEAQNAGEALRHVVGTQFTCELAKAIDVVNLMLEKGIRPEIAVSAKKEKTAASKDAETPAAGGNNADAANSSAAAAAAAQNSSAAAAAAAQNSSAADAAENDSDINGAAEELAGQEQ